MKLLYACFLLLSVSSWAGIVEDVRASIAAKNFSGGQKLVADYQKAKGTTGELALAASWLGRGALALKDYDQAEKFATDAGKLVFTALGKRRLDEDPFLPTALGAVIEVHAQVMKGRGEGAAAVEYLKGELKTYGKTSIAERISKNINLISLEGKPAPELEQAEWLGPKPRTIASLKGHPVLLFFWAHWCPDCKAMAPMISKLMLKYGPQGLALMGPTRYYGYVSNGDEAPPAQEKVYMEQVRQKYYAPLAAMPAPLSNNNFITYGSSSTPTLALVDAQGIVRWYHPGAATEAELEAKILQVLH